MKALLDGICAAITAVTWFVMGVLMIAVWASYVLMPVAILATVLWLLIHFAVHL